jgi:hypothetical protein
MSDVDHINDTIQDRLQADPKTYLSADSAYEDGGVLDLNVPIEYLNTLNLPGMPLHKTTLKIGCPIILIRTSIILRVCAMEPEWLSQS